jgi:hypothetical protein
MHKKQIAGVTIGNRARRQGRKEKIETPNWLTDHTQDPTGRVERTELDRAFMCCRLLAAGTGGQGIYIAAHPEWLSSYCFLTKQLAPRQSRL